jgi:hypothetical protein
MESVKTQNEEQKTTSNMEAKNSENNQNKENNSPIKAIANDALTQIKDKTSDVLSEQKSNLTTGIKDVAGSIRKVAENLGEIEQESNVGKMTVQYGITFAQGLERFSDYVENANLKNLARDVEVFARRQPTLFVAGAFALGLAAARFLKTARPLDNFSVALTENEARNKTNRKNYANPQQSMKSV